MSVLLGKGLNKLLHKFLLLSVMLGYALVCYYNYKGYLTLNQFVSATLMALMSISTLLLLSRSTRYEAVLPSMNLGKIACILPCILFLCAFSELRLYGHLGLLSVIVLAGIYVVLMFSKSNPAVVSTEVATLAVLIASLYGVYTPSFGNDTWRDAIQATQIIARGGLKDLTVIHQAYPIPVVPLLYAAYSMVVGLDTLWSSSVLGLLYLLLLALWIYTSARHAGAKYPHVAVVLALATPLVVARSVWFIPQAYSLLFALPVLLLDLHPSVLTVFALALVLGHGGLALWALTILVVLALTKRILRVRVPLNLVEVRLAIAALVFTLYAAYTTLSMMLRGTTSGIIEALVAFLRGERVLEAAAPIQTPPIAVLGVIPTIVLAVLGLVVLVEGGDAVRRLLAFTFLVGLGVAYVGAVAYPALDLPRYLGLSSTVMLAILSPQAVQVLAKRGHIATCYALSIILLAVISFGSAGTLMPENPYTANPYATWSISGLLTYSEALELDNLTSMLCCNNFLLDWRTGGYISHKYIWIYPVYRGFQYPKTQSSFTWAGSYGLLVTPEYLERSNEMLVLRFSALHMPGVFAQDILEYVWKKVTEGKVSVYYLSRHFIVLLLTQ